MSMKKVLLQAVRHPKHRKQVERMTEAEVSAFLRNLNNKEVKNNA